MVTLKRRSSLAKNAPSSWWDCPTCYHYGLIALLASEVRFVIGLSRSVGRHRVGRRGRGVELGGLASAFLEACHEAETRVSLLSSSQ